MNSSALRVRTRQSALELGTVFANPATTHAVRGVLRGALAQALPHVHRANVTITSLGMPTGRRLGDVSAPQEL